MCSPCKCQNQILSEWVIQPAEFRIGQYSVVDCCRFWIEVNRKLSHRASAAPRDRTPSRSRSRRMVALTWGLRSLAAAVCEKTPTLGNVDSCRASFCLPCKCPACKAGEKDSGGSMDVPENKAVAMEGENGGQEPYRSVQQLSFEFSGNAIDGLTLWREQRRELLRRLGVELGLPVGFSCEVVLENGIQVRGRLGLDEEGLFHSATRRDAKLRIRQNQLLHRRNCRLRSPRLKPTGGKPAPTTCWRARATSDSTNEKVILPWTHDPHPRAGVPSGDSVPRRVLALDFLQALPAIRSHAKKRRKIVENGRG